MTDKYIEIFGKYSTFDLAYMEGLTFSMEKEIKPIKTGTKMIGRAFTLDEKHGICMNIFKEIKKDEVLVVRGKDPSEHGGCGSMLSHWLKERGAAGVIIDGGAQDTEKIKKENFPVFCRYKVPTHGDTKWEGVTQVQISCGGVIVRPGDLIVGDDDGVVVIPKGSEEKILEEIKLFHQAADYLERNLRKGIELWKVKGLEEMWRQKESMGIYHWKVYRSWNERYIK